MESELTLASNLEFLRTLKQLYWEAVPPAITPFLHLFQKGVAKVLYSLATATLKGGACHQEVGTGSG